MGTGRFWERIGRVAWACAVLAATAVDSRASAADLQSPSSGDQEVLDAIRTGSNLPVLMSGAEPGSSSLEDWAATIERERHRLSVLVQAFGYLDGRVESIDASTMRAGTDSGARHLPAVQVHPNLGELYRIGSIEVLGVAGGDLDPEVQEDIRVLLSRFVGLTARADVLSKLESEIMFRVRNAGRPFAKVLVRELVSDQGSALAAARIAIDVGRSARLGPVVFHGLKRTASQSLEKYVPFVSGHPYRPAEVDALRAALEDLRLFRTVRVRVNESPDAAGLFPVDVRVEEEPPTREQLARGRLAGLMTMTAALVIVGVRQVSLAGGISSRSRRNRVLSAAVWILLVAAAALSAQRILILVNGV
jgi:hypothetical protein